MTEPTPGPWIRDPANPQNIIGNGPSWRSVALVRSDADARLIAKARHLPELIAALQSLDAYLDFGTPAKHGDWGIIDPSGLNEAFAEARAALALVQETADG